MQQGGTFTFAMWQSPDSLDPASTGLISANYVLTQMFEPLIWLRPGIDPDNIYFPGLATSWESSADAREYTLTLRQDVLFHDGTPLNAEAVKASFDHIVDPATQSLSAVGSLGPYDRAEVIDEFTVKIVFTEPNGAFLNNISSPLFSPSSPTALAAAGDAYGQAPVGTGPYRFKEWVINDHVTIERNPDYAWGSPTFTNQGPGNFDEIIFRIIPEAATRVNALRTGEVDLAENLPPQDLLSFSSDSNFQVFFSDVTGMPYNMMLNVMKAPLDDVRVRQALNFATSQEMIVEALYQGVYEPSHNIFLPLTLGYTEELNDLYTYDPARAGALLDEAGWLLDGDVRKKDGEELRLNILNIADFGFDDIALILQAQFAEVGIQADISAQAFQTVAAMYNAGEHHLANFFFYAIDPFFMKSLWGCDQIESGFNWMHYCDEELDALVMEGNATGDPVERAAIYSQAARKVMEEATNIPIYQQRVAFAGKASLQGLNFAVNGSPFFHDLTKAE
jgi:peptide/nickel transport system substrate-binding protein